MNNIYLVEGFDMVGKDTFVKKNLPNYRFYHCNHDLTDKTIGRHNSWAIGYGVFDFLEDIGIEKNAKFKNGVAINRGVLSSYVYSRIYNNKELDPQILEYYKNNQFFKEKVGHIYIKHQSAASAEAIFDKAQSREVAENAQTRQFDQFKSFRDYWILYSTADQMYRDLYKQLGITPRVFETIPDLTWNEVDFV